MSAMRPADDRFAERVSDNFARQKVMKLLGARLGRVEPGLVEIELPNRPEFEQQDGFVHAGILGTIVDSAGGYAAYTLTPAGTNVLTVEFKLNFLLPAVGDRFVGRGRAVRVGKSIAVCELEVEAWKGKERKVCVRGLQTIALIGGSFRSPVKND